LKQPPTPSNEKFRQLAVDELDLESLTNESPFDRITRLAATALNAPMCAFSVISGDRQVFKSAVGLDLFGTPRAVSICGYAVAAGGVLAIEDARCAPHFADNPLVRGAPAIRYYLGAPVRSPVGAAVGVLCVMDTQPRSIDEAQCKLIADLAHMLENELLLRWMAVRDPLTGLYARSTFCDVADRSLRRARSLGGSAGVILFSVDHYLSQVRTWGRYGADQALQIVGQCIGSSCAAPDHIAGRMHDDRFAVLITGRDGGAVRTAAETIRVSVAQQTRKDASARSITLSAGVALSGGTSGSAERGFFDVLERAHLAMCDAKATGGNRIGSPC